MNQEDANPMHEKSLLHWDTLKEAVRSGLITGEVIIKGKGHMALSTLILGMDGRIPGDWRGE